MKMQPSDTTDHRLPSSTRCLTHQGRSTGLEVKREEKEEKKYQAYWLCRAFSSMIFKEKYIYVEIKYGIYLQKKRKEKTQNPKKISLIFIFRKYIFHFFLFPWYKNVKYLTMICRKQIHGILSLLWSVSTEKGLVHGVDLLWFHTHAHVRILATSPPDTTKQTRHWAKTWNAALPGKTEINFSLVHPTMRNSHHRGKKNKKPLNKYAPKVKACVDGGRHLPVRKTSLGISRFQAALMRSRQTQLKSSWEAVPHPGAAPRPEREPLERFNPKFMVTAHKSVSSFCRSRGRSSPLGGFSHTDLWLQGFTQATNINF